MIEQDTRSLRSSSETMSSPAADAVHVADGPSVHPDSPQTHRSDPDSGIGTSSPGESPGLECDSPPWPITGNLDEPIAVVGMACRFSKVDSPSKLWSLISSGRTGHSKIPERSWHAEAWNHPSRQRVGEICASSGHFLDNISGFDAPFFSISASEAAAMDPMQRLGLEIAYEAFENAGIPMHRLANSSTAVYSGVMTNDYQILAESDPYQLGTNSAAGTGRSMLSNRISWFFDLLGPSLTLDTACSSSLYALHLACQSLRSGESSQALVTGHNLILHPTFFSQLSSMHMVSPDGASHSFDVSANGYGRGEGIAGIVVKRLSTALADGDVIRAVIRATGVNSDGKTPGITVPSEDAQVALIRKVYATAGLDMAQTAYFEAHGTGTPKGDPIEVRAISRTIAAARQTRGMDKLFLGSVKPNVGHTEGCSGLAGLIKTVLCLEAGVIPAVAGLREANPKLHIENSHMALPARNTVWPRGLRRASINSFGFGGANAHVVVDDARHHLEAAQIKGRHSTKSFTNAVALTREVNGEASPTATQLVPRRQQASFDEGRESPLVYAISAFDRNGIGRVAQSLGSFLQNQKSVALQSLAHVLAKRRTAHSFRSFLVAKTQEDLASRLQGDERAAMLTAHRSSQKRRLVFLFTGQGAQRPGMAAELLDHCPIFQDSIALSQTYLQQLGCQWDLVDLLKHADAESLSDAKHSQPACTAVQIALVDLLRHWGVVPSVVIGHSSGEIVAAYAADAVSHVDAIRVAYYRGVFSTQICQRVGRQGAMLAVGLGETESRTFLSEHGMSGAITVACINSPQSVTLSGDAVEISQAEEAFRAAGHFVRPLRTGGVAYHSPDMDVVGVDFLHAMGLLSPRRRTLSTPMYSSVTECLVTNTSALSASYWHLNMTSPVRFAGAMENLLRDTCVADMQHTTVLEIGPSKTLSGPVSQIMSTLNQSKTLGSVPYVSMLGAAEDSQLSTLQTAGTLWAAGVSIDLDKVNQLSTHVHRLPLKELHMLPSYPWNHTKPHWHESNYSAALRARKTARTDLLGVPVAPQNPFEPAWHNMLHKRDLPWLADHTVAGTILFPAAAYMGMAIEAVQILSREKSYPLSGVELTDVHFESGLPIGEDNDDGQGVMLTLRPDHNELWTFAFVVYATSTDSDGWLRLASGTVSGIPIESAEAEETDFEREAREFEWTKDKKPQIHRAKSSKANSVDIEQFYTHLATIGLDYGPTFRGLRAVRSGAPAEASGRSIGEAFGELVIPDTESVMPENYESDYLIHPATLDGLFQLVFAALQSGPSGAMDQAAVPVSLRRAFIATSIPRDAGTKLLGVATAERLRGEAAASSSVSNIKGSLTFSDENLDKLAVLVEDIVLRDMPRGTSSDSNSYAGIQKSTELQELVKLRRTAELVWKEDITQSFSLWKDVATSEPCLNGRCAWLVDRICHKEAGSKILFLGAAEIRDHILKKLGDDSCIGMPSQWGSYASFESPSLWQAKQGDESTTSAAKSERLTYDLILLGADFIQRTNDLGCSIPDGLNVLRNALRNACSTSTWLILVDAGTTDSKELRTLAESLEGLPNINLACLSSSSSDVLLTEKGFYSPSVQRERPKALQEDIVIIGPSDVDSIPTSDIPYLVQTRELLSARLESTGRRVHYTTLDKVTASRDQLHEKTVISLVEYGTPFVHTWSNQGFKDFRQLISSTSKLLWITTGGFLEPESEISLHYAPTVGLLRTVRAEYPDLLLPHLDLSPSTCSSGPVKAVDMIMETVSMTFGRHRQLDEEPEAAGADSRFTEPETSENEYCEKDGRLFIPRAMTHAEADEYIATETPGLGGHRLTVALQDTLENVILCASEAPQLWLRNTAGLQTPTWVLQSRVHIHDDGARKTSSLKLKSGEALIQASCFAVHAGVGQAADGFDAFIPTCQQAVGVLHQLSKTQGLKTDCQKLCNGDIVLCLSPSTVQPVSVQKTEDLVRLPKTVAESPAAAAFWLGPLSVAFYILSEVALVSPGDAVLIDIGNDRILQNALVLASQCLGIKEVFVICARTLDSDLKLSSDVAVTKLSGLTRATANYLRSSTGGIKAVVSTLQNPRSQRQYLSSLTDGGCVVGLGVEARPRAPLNLADKSASLRLLDHVELNFSNDHHGQGLRKALESVLESIAGGHIALPQPTRHTQTSDMRLVSEFCKPPKSELNEATRGCISLSRFEKVNIFSPSSPEEGVHGATTTALDPEGTYIISGGLGALGLPLARTLFELGARHLVLLSRSGKATSPEAKTELERLNAEGCSVDIQKCDITSENDLKQLALWINNSPTCRVRGIIQSAMVLADRTFANMTMEEWQAATAPKIRGSWNLHQLENFLAGTEGTDSSLRKSPLDFFIMLSSVSGVIGNTAQANYCAGNTFEDALAHHRRANGRHGLSLDIGLVSDSSHYGNGTMSAFKTVEEYLAVFGHLTPVKVSTSETLASVKMAVISATSSRISQSRPVLPQLPPQLIVGISNRIPRHRDMLNRWPMDRKFDHRAGSVTEGDPGSTHAGLSQTQLGAAERFASATGVDEARQVVEEMMRQKVSQAMTIELDNVDEEKSLVAYGIDSLKATEVRNWLVREFKSELSVFDILAPVSIRKLSMSILKASKLVERDKLGLES